MFIRYWWYLSKKLYWLLYTATLDNLQEIKQIPGIITGKQGGNSIYIPTIYSKNQNNWVENFYKQNGYLGNVWDK